MIIRLLTQYADDFDKCNDYIRDPKTFVNKWIDDTVNKRLWEGEQRCFYVTCGSERLDKLYEDILASMKKAKDKVRENVESDIPINIWLKEFEQALPEYISIQYATLRQVDNFSINSIDSFQSSVEEHLKQKIGEWKDALQNKPKELVKWDKHTPTQQIFEKLWGCHAECPFCSEPCQYNDPNHTDVRKHSCIQHRPESFAQFAGNWNSLGENLNLKICSHLVCTTQKFLCPRVDCPGREKPDTWRYRHEHPYNEYRKYYPDWDIVPDRADTESKFWKWFIVKHKERIEKHYQCKALNIPQSWKRIRRPEALRSLQVLNR